MVPHSIILSWYCRIDGGATSGNIKSMLFLILWPIGNTPVIVLACYLMLLSVPTTQLPHFTFKPAPMLGSADHWPVLHQWAWLVRLGDSVSNVAGPAGPMEIYIPVLGWLLVFCHDFNSDDNYGGGRICSSRKHSNIVLKKLKITPFEKNNPLQSIYVQKWPTLLIHYSPRIDVHS